MCEVGSSSAKKNMYIKPPVHLSKEKTSARPDDGRAYVGAFASRHLSK